jgi:hypothetical protein
MIAITLLVACGMGKLAVLTTPAGDHTLSVDGGMCCVLTMLVGFLLSDAGSAAREAMKGAKKSGKGE